MARVIPASMWLTKAKRVLVEFPEEYRCERVEGLTNDGSEEVTDIDPTTLDRLPEGQYRLIKINGDDERVVSQCSVSRTGARVSGSPDPLTAGARSMALLSEGWNSLASAQGGMLAKYEAKIEKLQAELDKWKDDYRELLMSQEEDTSETKLYGLLEKGLAVYMARDKKNAAFEFFRERVLPGLTEEERNALLPAVNKALTDNSDLMTVFVAAGEDES